MTYGRGSVSGMAARVALVLLGGCASVSNHRAPTPDELRLVENVEVTSPEAGVRVRRLDARYPGVPADAAVRPLPTIELAADAQATIADAVVSAGTSETSLPFRRAGEPGGRAGRAVLDVRLLSVTLAAGAGPDPLTALWVRLRARLTLPQDPAADPRFAAPELGALEAVAVAPVLRPLSEWLVRDAAPLREAVAALSRQLAPRLVADLRGSAPPVAADVSAAGRASGAVEVAAFRSDGAQPSLPVPAQTQAPPSAATPLPLRMEFLSHDGTSHAWTVVGAIGGGVAGFVVGGARGLRVCAPLWAALAKLSLNDPVLVVILAPVWIPVGAAALACTAVALPVGAVAGMVVGAAAGRELGAWLDHARRAEHDRMVASFVGKPPPGGIAAALSRSSEALAGNGAADTALRDAVVRLVEDADQPRLASLELELTLGTDAAQHGPPRRICLGGPGPVPTELWLDEATGLLRTAVEAQLARAVDAVRAGAAPVPGDFPCRPVPETPAPPAAATPAS